MTVTNTNTNKAITELAQAIAGQAEALAKGETNTLASAALIKSNAEWLYAIVKARADTEPTS